MAVEESLPVPYRQQDTADFCGAACVQMVLAGIGSDMTSQNQLHLEGRSRSLDRYWYPGIGPDGLQYMLNARRPNNFKSRFAVISAVSPDTLSRELCWTIHHHRFAPIAAVYYTQHWIVVRGFHSSNAPASSTDTDYTITGFAIHDPDQRRAGNQHISYAEWLSSYLVSVPVGNWKGRYVAIAVADPLSTAPPASPAP